jgi:peroxiredoxin
VNEADSNPGGTGGVGTGGIVAYLVFLVVGGLLVGGFAWSLAPAAQAQRGAACRAMEPEPRDVQAPDIELFDMEGNAVRLSDFRGKFVVINFWATYCEPCTKEWPDLDKLGRRLEDREDVVILAVSVDEKLDPIAPYVERMSLGETRVKVLWDPTGQVNRQFGSENIPDTFFVDATGKIRSAFVNVRQWGRPEAFRCVDAMAAG